MGSPLTALDILIIAILLISGGLALLRGFTREILSIISWAAAAIATLVFFPMFQPQLRAFVHPPWLSDISLAVGIFLVVLVLVSIITMQISDKVLDSRIGALDRTLGFIFGVARGFVLVVVAYLFFVWLVPPKQFPEWISQARALPHLKTSGAKMLSWLPETPEGLIPNMKKAEKSKTAGGGKAGEVKKAPPGNVKVKPSDKPNMPADPGYKNSQRQGMEQLLESTQGVKPQ